MKKKAAAAPYSIEDLDNWDKRTRGIEPPIRLGIVGDPVEHSLSPTIQNAALRDCGISMQYALFHIRSADLEQSIERFAQTEFVGLNVTLPHKERVAEFLDALDPDAKQIGAVNTIVFQDGRKIGFNTDGIGFSRAVREAFSVDLRDLRVLLLGAGGAGHAIAFECARENCQRV